MNAISGGKHKPQNQSPLVGLASSLLGGQHGGQTSHSNNSSGGIGGLAGQLVGSFLDSGGKPQQQQQQPPSSQSGGGFMSFFGGQHGSSVYFANLFGSCHMLIDSAGPEQQLRIFNRRAKFKQWRLLRTGSTSVIPSARTACVFGYTATATAPAATTTEQHWWLLLSSSTSVVYDFGATRICWCTSCCCYAIPSWTLGQR